MKRFLLLTSCLLASAPAFAQSALTQSPAYKECSTLAGTNPEQALAKAESWLVIDNGIPAQHCRAMALYGLRRFDEAATALAAVRDAIAPDNIALRSYITRQTSRAMVNANRADQALALLGSQIGDISRVRGDNANAARMTAELLLDRARINATYGKLTDATQDLDHAVSLTPINEEVLIERASVFEKLGDSALARNDAEVVLKLNAGSKPAREILARLNGAPTTTLLAPINQAPELAPAAGNSAVPVVDAAAPAAKPKTYKKSYKKPAIKSEAP